LAKKRKKLLFCKPPTAIGKKGGAITAQTTMRKLSISGNHQRNMSAKEEDSNKKTTNEGEKKKRYGKPKTKPSRKGKKETSLRKNRRNKT